MNSFFRYDGFLMRILTKVMYLISLNLLFLLCCIPIFTIGASCTALHAVMMEYQQGDEPDILRGFLKAFLNNFKTSTMIWCGMLPFVLSIGLNYYLTYRNGMGHYHLLTALLNLMLFFWMVLCLYVFPSIAYFDNNIKGYLRFSMALSFRKLPLSLLMLAVHAICIITGLFLAQYIPAATLFFLLCGFSLPVSITDRWLIKLFAHYGDKQNEPDEALVS